MLGLALVGAVLVITTMVGGQRGRHSNKDKWEACKAYWMAKGELAASGQDGDESKVMKLATDKFLLCYNGGMQRHNANEFIKRWATRGEPPNFSDRWRGHNQEVITDEQCSMCIAELRKGYYANGKHWWFTSLNHAAQRSELCPTVALCRALYSADHEYSMFRRLQEFDPLLIHLKPKTRHPLTPKIMEERCATSSFYLTQDKEFFERVFYIDQKVFLMHPASGMVIGYEADRDEYVTEIDDITFYNIATRKTELVRVEVYAMVNYHGGLCGWHVCHGTSGDDRVYLVRHPMLQNPWGACCGSLLAFSASCSASLHELSECLWLRRNTFHPALLPISTKLSSVSPCTWAGLPGMHRSACVGPSTWIARRLLSGKYTHTSTDPGHTFFPTPSAPCPHATWSWVDHTSSSNSLSSISSSLHSSLPNALAMPLLRE